MKSLEEKDKLVSVVMATFNESPEMISKSIESILNQSYQNIELCIMDDSTNEDTIQTIESFCKDERVRVFRSSERLGFIRSLNRGLEESRGGYIARMDGDDIALPRRIETEVKFLEANSEVMVVGGQINIIDKNDVVTSKRNYPTGGFKFWLFSCYRNPLAHPTIMMRRELVDQGYRYDENLKMSEDLDFWLRLMNKGYKLANTKSVVLNYRVMDNFLEKRSSDTQRKVMAQVRRKNFCWKHFIHSTLSVMAGVLFNIVPRGAIDKAYKKENKQ